MKPRLAHFKIELNDSRWISEMFRWKATSKGFPTGYRRDPSAVVKINRGSLENLDQKQILYQKQINPSYGLAESIVLLPAAVFVCTWWFLVMHW